MYLVNIAILLWIVFACVSVLIDTEKTDLTTKIIWEGIGWPILAVIWLFWVSVSFVNDSIYLILLGFGFNYKNTRLYSTINDITNRHI